MQRQRGRETGTETKSDRYRDRERNRKTERKREYSIKEKICMVIRNIYTKLSNCQLGGVNG